VELSSLAARLNPYLEQSVLIRGLQPAWPQSRWHLTRTLSGRMWIKRDDELSFGISGSKYRKLASLMPFLHAQGAKRVVSWGSARSHFLLGLLQLCRESGLDTHVYLLRSTPWAAEGLDLLFRSQIGSSPHTWIDRDAWPQVRDRVASEARDDVSTWIVPEGGVHLAALPGAMTLGLDIVRQEHLLGERLVTMWIDAGTGFTAQALLCALGYLGRELEVNVLLCAGNEEEFRTGIEERLRECDRLFGDRPSELPPFRCHRPPTARSFGAVNRQVCKTIERVAREEGIWLDPLYSAKLWMTVETQPRESPSLFVHSGGGLSLFAFPKLWSQ
jgi:1-aminocyclopropane-1-carboxylate deaminase